MGDMLDKLRKKQAEQGVVGVPPATGRPLIKKPGGERPQTPRKKGPNYKPGPKTKDRRKARRLKGRLPHGSEYRKVYDADRQQWTGMLIVPGGDPALEGCLFKTFTGVEGGSFLLEHKLDDQFRASVKEQEKPVD
jgi:hypothetical protein